jgi:hypothetical protein
MAWEALIRGLLEHAFRYKSDTRVREWLRTHAQIER